MNARTEDQLAARRAANAQTSTGTPATGDNGGGRKPAARKPAAAKPAAAKPKPAPAKKAPEFTATAKKRVVSAVMVKTLGDLVDRWNEKATGVTREEARAALASYANYSSCQADQWDARLGDRSNAGGRGAKNRQSGA